MNCTVTRRETNLPAADPVRPGTGRECPYTSTSPENMHTRGLSLSAHWMRHAPHRQTSHAAMQHLLNWRETQCTTQPQSAWEAGNDSNRDVVSRCAHFSARLLCHPPKESLIALNAAVCIPATHLVPRFTSRCLSLVRIKNGWEEGGAMATSSLKQPVREQLRGVT